MRKTIAQMKNILDMINRKMGYTEDSKEFMFIETQKLERCFYKVVSHEGSCNVSSNLVFNELECFLRGMLELTRQLK